ncbi:MAG: hypothetical protein BWY46_00116 [Firmicutes bacterium ADurb.Bin300]|nr:MAG: hypothetical protein BWY46_00116 [Firmicutes bacterium ADurb.Bin300]
MTAIKIGIAAAVLCVLALLGACRGNNLGNTTTTRTPINANTSTTLSDTQSGIISDTSDTGNGLAGDIVSDISGAISNAVSTTAR